MGKIYLSPRQLSFLIGLGVILVLTAVFSGVKFYSLQKLAQQKMASLVNLRQLKPLASVKNSHWEVFGFAPFWTIDKLDNVDFGTLTTLAYFGIPALPSGDLDKSDYGYEVFKGKKATELFRRAHQAGTKVVLTITQMNNWPIIALLDDPSAQENLIAQVVGEVQNRGIDGVNVDFEYDGDPGEGYRRLFTQFVGNLTQAMHGQNPNFKVTVSVYAASVKDPKIYDIGKLSQSADGIFMMAYDFATLGAEAVMPTSPLYGHQEGKYWYDVSTAVADFLIMMPPQKLILGLPWYGYNYPVSEPEIKAPTLSYWWGNRASVQTYSASQQLARPDREDISEFKSGWDNSGQVGWRAYFLPATGTWRMVFIEDPASLGIKYDFAKNKNLAGVGIWALGFDHGRRELWELIRDKFGLKLADNSVLGKPIYEL